MPLTLRSTDFVALGDIPAVYTCDGEGLSPSLEWEQLPAGTRALVLIVDDPDAPDPAAPERVFTHWVAYNVPPSVGRLEAAASGASPSAMPDPAREARNDAGGAGYVGPCPPIGRHRYFFHLHALDAELGDLGPDATRREVEAAMRGHVLESTELMATYGPRG